MLLLKTLSSIPVFILTTIMSLAYMEISFAQATQTSGIPPTDEAPQETLKITEVMDMQEVGKGQFKVAFWKLYDIVLFAPQGHYNASQPFALELTYSRQLKGKLIAEKSIELIKKQGVDNQEILKNWQAQLTTLIPDISKGDVLTGVKTDDGMLLYLNNIELGKLEDHTLSICFFNIWLGEDTTAPKLREKLLNGPLVKKL